MKAYTGRSASSGQMPGTRTAIGSCRVARNPPGYSRSSPHRRSGGPAGNRQAGDGKRICLGLRIGGLGRLLIDERCSKF